MFPAWQSGRGQAGDIHEWIKRFTWQIPFLVFNLSVLSVTDIIPSTVDGRIWVLSIDTVVGDNQSAREKRSCPSATLSVTHPIHLGIYSSSWITKCKYFSFFYSSPLGSSLCRSSKIPYWIWTPLYPMDGGLLLHCILRGQKIGERTIPLEFELTIPVSEQPTSVRLFGHCEHNLDIWDTSHCSQKPIQWMKAWHNEWLDGHVEAKNTFVWEVTKTPRNFEPPPCAK
jgi:hypothetical protein